MKIIQITDLHIELKEEAPFGIDVIKNFQDILHTVQELKPDHLVVSGDLCYREGEEAIYRWCKKHLDQCGIPYDVIAGNHDDSTLMAKTFALEHLLNDGELYFTKKIGKYPIIFLDTALRQHSDNQLKWLRRQLHQANQEVVIFMHHPPIHSSVPFMDNNHALKDMDAVQAIFFEHPHPVNVFCGHYHVEKTVRLRNIMLQITPSCFFQIDHYEENFKVDHHRIALREIIIEQQQLLSRVHYLPGNTPGLE
ncbi:MAG: metallophosphoesterase [Bacteroidota bacterium]